MNVVETCETPVYFLSRPHLSQMRTRARPPAGLFDGRPADYAFMWLFNWLCCVIVGFILDFKILMDLMVLSVMYVWCQLNKDTIVNFWFGTQFKVGTIYR